MAKKIKKTAKKITGPITEYLKRRETYPASSGRGEVYPGCAPKGVCIHGFELDESCPHCERLADNAEEQRLWSKGIATIRVVSDGDPSVGISGDEVKCLVSQIIAYNMLAIHAGDNHDGWEPNKQLRADLKEFWTSWCDGPVKVLWPGEVEEGVTQAQMDEMVYSPFDE